MSNSIRSTTCPCTSQHQSPSPLVPHASRRSFIRHFSLLSATAYAAHQTTSIQLLAQSIPSPAANTTDGTLRIRTTDFFALQFDSGSVRIGVNGVRADHFPDGPYYPLLINRLSGGRFIALSAQCRHANCVVEPYDDLDQGMRCPCHDSLYSLDGKVLRPPANRPLTSFTITPEPNDILAITLPGFGFQMTATALTLTPGAPLKLTFPTLNGVQYELLSSNASSDRGTPVPFALQPNAAPDQTVLDGTGSTATLYPAPPEAPTPGTTSALFYSIRMVFNEV